MSGCFDGKVIWGPGFLFQSNPGTGGVTVVTEAYFNSLADLYMGTYGVDCATAKGALLGDLQASGGAFVIRDGCTIPAFDQSMVSMSMGNSGRLGLDGVVVGTWIYSGDGFESNCPAATAGVDFQEFYVMERSAAAGEIYWQIPASELIHTINFEDWWCCVSAGYDCCGGPAVGSPAKFQLPLSSDTPREVGDEQLVSPTLETPLYVSNFSFQYVRGMMPKNITF